MAALDVSTFVSVPAANAHKHRGSILLTDVDLVPLRAVNWLFYRLNGDDQIYPKTQVIGTLTPGQYNEQGTIDMVTLARQAATVVEGLRAVGYDASAISRRRRRQLLPTRNELPGVVVAGDPVTS